MPHICMDEIMAVLMVLPFVGVGITWVRNKIKRLRKGK